MNKRVYIEEGDKLIANFIDGKFQAVAMESNWFEIHDPANAFYVYSKVLGHPAFGNEVDYWLCRLHPGRNEVEDED